MMIAASEALNQLSSGWFLDHAYLIPIVPAVCFFIIILQAHPTWFISTCY